MESQAVPKRYRIYSVTMTKLLAVKQIASSHDLRTLRVGKHLMTIASQIRLIVQGGSALYKISIERLTVTVFKLFDDFFRFDRMHYAFFNTETIGRNIPSKYILHFMSQPLVDRRELLVNLLAHYGSLERISHKS